MRTKRVINSAGACGRNFKNAAVAFPTFGEMELCVALTRRTQSVTIEETLSK